MTREEEIEKALNFYAPSWWGDKGEAMSDRELTASYCGFRKGVKWADEHPHSPWISVNDDLPCNHEELINSFYTNFTNEVLAVYENKYIALDRMVKDDKGNWKFVGNVLYWMPIIEPPK